MSSYQAVLPEASVLLSKEARNFTLVTEFVRDFGFDVDYVFRSSRSVGVRDFDPAITVLE